VVVVFESAGTGSVDVDVDVDVGSTIVDASSLLCF